MFRGTGCSLLQLLSSMMVSLWLGSTVGFWKHKWKLPKRGQDT